MLRRIALDDADSAPARTDDVDLRDGAGGAGEPQDAAVANPRRTRR